MTANDQCQKEGKVYVPSYGCLPPDEAAAKQCEQQAQQTGEDLIFVNGSCRPRSPAESCAARGGVWAADNDGGYYCAGVGGGGDGGD